MTPPDAKAELLPCPFCGWAAEVSDYLYPFHKDAWHVRCTDCGVITPVCETRRDAVRLWNRRTPPVEGG